MLKQRINRLARDVLYVRSMKTTTEALQSLDLSTLSTVTGGASWQQPAGQWGGAAGSGAAWAKPAQSWSQGQGANWTGGAPTTQWSGK